MDKVKNRVIIIAGPTASGKSALAIDVAGSLNGVVINADSQQVYKDTPILSACPSEEDKTLVEHRLYQIYEAEHHGNVVDWLTKAVEEIKDLWANDKIPVLVGGSGMYIDNLLNGVTPIEEISQETKDLVEKQIQQNGLKFVYDKLDEETKQQIHENDATRVSRAYAVWLQTGKTLAYWHSLPKIKKLPEAKFFVVKILPSVEQTDEFCALRFEKMMQNGVVDEVKVLKAKNLSKTLPAMKTLGVPEIIDYLEEKISLGELENLIKLRTRQYAKRQRTWFANKLKADVQINEIYTGQKNLLKNIIDLAQKD